MSAQDGKPFVPTDDLFNKLGTDYEDAFGENERLISIINRFLAPLPEKSLVLDCGSGTGRPVSQMVVASGRQVLGIDYSQTMVDISRKQVPGGHFEHCDMMKYSPHDKAFSGIVAAFSLFMFTRSEITSLIRKWYQWLAPDGRLLIVSISADDCKNTQPEMFDTDGQFAGGVSWNFMGHKVLLSLFTKAGWCKLLEDAGFEIEHTETNNFKPEGPAASDEENQIFVIAKK